MKVLFLKIYILIWEDKMELLSECCSLELLSIDYDMNTGLIKFQLSGDGINGVFLARASCGNEIKCITFESDFDEFLMSLMPLQPKIYSMLGGLTWGYINGENISFPQKLID